MIQTYREFIEADAQAEGLTIPFREVYGILETKWSEVEEHPFRKRGNYYERHSYEWRLKYTLELLSKDKWLLYLDKYGNIYSGVIM